MTMTRVRRAAAGLWVVGCLACGSQPAEAPATPADAGTAADAGGDAGLAEGSTYSDHFCKTLPDWYCGYAVRCELMSSVANCQRVAARGGGDCGRHEDAAVRDGRMAFDAGAAQRCHAALRDTVSCSNVAPEPSADCQGAQTGLVPTNGACYSDAECDRTAWCYLATCPGTCQPRKPAGAQTTATTLSGMARECQDGLTRTDGTCQAIVGPGGSCAPIPPATGTRTCVPTHYCGPGQICTARKAPGAACTVNECAVPYACVAGTCGKAADIGAACSAQRPCKYDLFCDSAVLWGDGVCSEPSSAGGPCRFPWDCQAGLYCSGTMALKVRGTCAAQKPTAETCGGVDPGECAAGNCINGRCAAYQTAGQACTTGTCGANLTCATTCVPVGCFDPTP